MERYREIEKSIIKKYRKTIWSPFVKAVKEFNLINEGDKIAVCISGGKDSMLLAKCMQELQNHGIFKFELEFLVMNPGYTDEVLLVIENNAKLMNIPITIFKTPIFEKVSEYNSGEACYKCAKMRRGYLYSKASEMGCNKIALGHHFDDVIETILLNLLYTGNYAGMMPKIKSDNFSNMELIRPLFYVHEQDIITFKNHNQLTFIDCACHVTKKNIGKRKYVKELIKSLKIDNKQADLSIFRSMFNVNLNKVIGYKQEDNEFNYYQERK